MASTSAFSVLPIIGYALLAVLLAYLALRLFRHFKSKTRISASTSLPKPVSGAAAKNTFSLGRTTAWDWSRWTLPTLPRVPWVRVPSVSEMASGTGVSGKSAKNAKNLSVELLPTTGLPPPPSTPISMPTPQLVDIGSPPTPALTAASGSGTSTSYPDSPRTPSPPFLQQPHLHHAHVPKTLHPVHHPSYPRPPSPHALLATTPPQKHSAHKRSRSLGGVPVRRLSGGAASSLRNAVELEMKDLSHGNSRDKDHTRGTSREHLLIDFSSSGSSDEIDDVSPAASDIGVLPLHAHGQPSYISGYGYDSTHPSRSSSSSVLTLPVRVDARRVGRHVPLVDLGDDETVISGLNEDRHFDDDGWKWFGTGPEAELTSPAVKPKREDGFPVAKTEKLVDVDVDAYVHPELDSGAQVVHIRRADVGGIEEEEEVLVDVSEKRAAVFDGPTKGVKEVPLVDLNRADVDVEVRLVDVESGEFNREDWPEYDNYETKHEHGNELNDTDHESRHDYLNDQPILKPSPALSVVSSPPPAPAPVYVKSAFSHPLEDADFVRINAPPEEPHPIVEASIVVEDRLLFAQAEPAKRELDHNPPLVDVDAEHLTSAASSHSLPPSPSPLFMTSAMDPESQGDAGPSWSWDEVDVDDPWSNHVVAPTTSTGASAVAFLPESNSDSDLIMFESSNTSGSTETLAVLVEDVLEKSPGGSLAPTVLNEDEEEAMPVLDLEALEGGVGYFEETKEQEEKAVGVEDERSEVSVEEQEEEEDVTPKPTPASLKIDLPASDVELDAIVVLQEQAAEEAQEQCIEEEYPDPELLPLPLDSDLLLASSPILSLVEVPAEQSAAEEQLMDFAYDQERDAKASKAALSQTPTPPASPPPISGSHLRVFGTTNSNGSSRATSPVSPRLAVVLPLAPPPPVSLNDREDGDKENETPTALSANGRPLWSIRASDAPALGLPSSGLVIGSSPRSRRRVLADVTADANAELEEKMEVQKEAEQGEKLEVRENDEQVSESVVEKENGDVEITLATEEQEIYAPQMKLSSSLPGSFPESDPPTVVVSPPKADTEPSAATTSTVAPTHQTPVRAFTFPSARNIVRSPLDIALAMQLRPGLGAGADPAWMVRFLMAMYGWLALVIAGGGDF